MPDIKSTRTEDIALGQIEITDRVRKVSDSAVEIIVMSIQDLGVITSPIHVRKMRSGFRLIDGAHRLAAAKKIGLEVIPAKVWDVTADQADLMESDANIATAHMSPLEFAVSLSARKSTYQKIHPETRQGVAGSASRWGHKMQATEMSFASWMADVLGVSKRQVERIIAAGDALEPDEVEALRAAPKRVVMADLYQIAKIGEPADRWKVCHALREGKAKSVAAALKAAKALPGDAKKSKTDAQLRKLNDTFARASKSARRQFVDTNRDALIALLAELQSDGAGDGDVASFASARAAS